jgi:hypothetical protein
MPTLNIAGRLVVNGRTVPLGQIRGRTLVLMEACQLPPGDAELIVTVLGQEKVYRIFLPHGHGGQSDVASYF